MSEDTFWLALWIASAIGGVIFMAGLYNLDEVLGRFVLEGMMRVLG